MIFKVLRSEEGELLARELAEQLLQQLGSVADRSHRKFESRAGRALKSAEQRIDAFKRVHRLNWLQRSRMSNTFLWALKDGGCADDYAQELTQWLLARL
jgi:ElaB/YqjD/DUF883 family membrane-anchored ribosome-binding protein